MAQFAYTEAAAQFEGALADVTVLGSGEDEVRICKKIGRSLFYGTRPDLATTWLERALERCRAQHALQQEIPKIMLLLSQQCWLNSRTSDSLALVEGARERALSLKDHDLIRQADRQTAFDLVMLGRYDNALEQLLRKALLSSDTEPESAAPEGAALAMTQYAIIKAAQGDASAAFGSFKRASEMAARFRDGFILTDIWADNAISATLLGRVDIARANWERALIVARERRIVWRIPYFTLRLACLLVMLGDYQHAHDLVADAILYDTETPVLRVLRSTVCVTLAQAIGDESFLRQAYDEGALDYAFRSREPRRIAAIVAAYAKAQIAKGNLQHAQSLITRGLSVISHADQGGDLLAMAACYGLPEDAFCARELLLKRIQLPHHRIAKAYLDLWEAYKAHHESSIDALRLYAKRAAQRFERLGWLHQRNEALALLTNRDHISSKDGRRTTTILTNTEPRLTEREQDVGELVLRGMTNRAIAQALDISEHTVEKHMTSILARLGLRSRWQLHDLT